MDHRSTRAALVGPQWRAYAHRPQDELMTDLRAGSRMPTIWHITPETLDIALRYQRLLALIKDRYHPALRILELGSGSGGLTEFLDHRVTGVDTAFDRTAERFSDRLLPVEADATDVPLPDAEYDVVVSVDMFEHLAADARASALSEMLRLLAPGGRMAIGFPAGPVAAKLDRRLNDSFAHHHGRQHPWALEHIEHGLPDPDVVEVTLRELAPAGAIVRRYRHLWGPAWWTIGALYTIRLHETAARRLGLWSDRAARLLFELVKGLNHGGCYRTFFVVDKPSA
jgi:SAM-dependent methyltransferase